MVKQDLLYRQKGGSQMLIVAGNKIRNRRYNVTTYKNDVVVSRDSYVTAKEKREIITEAHKNGFRVHSEEVFSVTKNIQIVGESPVNNNVPDKNKSRFTPGPVEATKSIIERDRNKGRVIADHRERVKLNKNGKTVIRSGSNGRDKNSPLHQEWLAVMKNRGYKVHNLKNNRYFYGTHLDVMEYMNEKGKQGYKLSDFEIKYIGKKD